MSTQRSAEGAAETRSTRRAFLAGSAAAAVGSVAGCVGQGALSGRGALGGDGGDDGRPVSILSAGSLHLALTKGLASAVDVPIQVESHGSATVARLVEAGRRDPAAVSLADTALFDGPLSPEWSVGFASNEVVLAYNPDTRGGERVADAGREGWFRALSSDEVSLGRTDPDQDPLGYRTLFALSLASRYYGLSDLRERLLAPDQVYPETSLVSQFETGAVDAAFTYRNMATSRGYAHVELPDEVNLGSPEHAADWYRTVSHTLPSGKTVRGDVIEYAATLRHRREAADAVFAEHVTGDYLETYGFTVPATFPRLSPDVPAGIRDRIEGER